MSFRETRLAGAMAVAALLAVAPMTVLANGGDHGLAAGADISAGSTGSADVGRGNGPANVAADLSASRGRSGASGVPAGTMSPVDPPEVLGPAALAAGEAETPANAPASAGGPAATQAATLVSPWNPMGQSLARLPGIVH
jgi:hypothetical protein